MTNDRDQDDREQADPNPGDREDTAHTGQEPGAGQAAPSDGTDVGGSRPVRTGADQAAINREDDPPA